MSDEYRQISPKILKFPSGQLNKFSVSVRPYREHHDLNIDGFCVVKVTNLDVRTCKFVKIISRTNSITSSTLFHLGGGGGGGEDVFKFLLNDLRYLNEILQVCSDMYEAYFRQ